MKKLNFTKKIFLTLVLVLSAFFLNSVFLFSFQTKNEKFANAVTSYYGKNTVTITNGNFSSAGSKKGSGLPYEISSGWKVASEYSNSSGVVSGIIDVSTTKFSDNSSYGLSQNPETDTSINVNNRDNFILMIKSDARTTYGYMSSSKIKLESSKFYVLSVHVKTTNNAVASIYTSLSDNNDDNFISITTNNSWQTYYYYISTDTFNSKEFEISLMLGSKQLPSSGAVFFDNVELFEIANSDYFEKIGSKDTQQRNINFDNDYVSVDKNFVNANFENTSTPMIGWEDLVSEKVDNEESVVKISTPTDIEQTINLKLNKKYSNIANNNVYDNQNELLILNITTAYSGIKSKNNSITIPQHGFYLLSMLIKTGDLSSGGLNVTLYQDGKEDKKLTQSDLTSSSGLSQYNGFSKVDFYIRGSVASEAKVNLSLSLGTSSSKISGWAIVDNITLQKINYDEYKKGTSSTQFDLSSEFVDSASISNGSFDFIKNSDNTVSYPAEPEYWTKSETMQKSLVKSGIIRVKDSYFAQDYTNYGLYVSQNPGVNTSGGRYKGFSDLGNIPENVLMVVNDGKDDVYFKSSPQNELTLSASSSSSVNIAKIKVGVKTLGSNTKAFINVLSGEDVIAVIDKISATDWETYTLYVKCGLTSKPISLALGTHGKTTTSNVNNYAFFDHVEYTTITSADEISAELEKGKAIYVDLLNNSFTNYSNSIVTTHRNGATYDVKKQYALPLYSYEETQSAGMYNGIINLSNSENRNLQIREGATDKNVLVVSNNTPTYQVLKTDSYKLTSGNYYEFSVFVKTLNLEGNTSLSDYNKDNKNYGAYFELVSLDNDGKIITDENNKNKFINFAVNSDNNNGWVKYSMYILAEAEQTVQVLLGLGTENYKTSGTVYFDDLVVTDITQSAYTEQKADANTIVSKVIEPVKQDDTTTTNKNNEGLNINIWALLSSIMLVIALILAIVGYLIRRIPKRQIAKIEATEYNKSPFAVDENKIKREMKVQREAKIEALKKQIETLENEKAQIIKEYNEKLEQENQEQPNSGSLYVKHIKTLNKCDKRIEYLKSALAYISDPTIIKMQEISEIKRQKNNSEEEFLKLKEEQLNKESENPIK